jgi:RNA recognition motif-containing protein
VKKMFVGNLPPEASEESVREMFSEFGTVRSVQIAADVFSGKCRGFGFVEMEGHEARAAMAGLNGRTMAEKALVVRFEDARKARGRGRR